jgi:penicillin-binding protein 2
MDPNKVVNCQGYFVLKGLTDTIIYDYAVLGSLNLYEAIGKSASVYFYTMGYKIGPTIIMDYANYFGYSEKTEVDIPGEIAGFVPSKNWKRKVFGQGWFDGDTINLSIGQGFLNVTPIEVASFVSGIVNNGLIFRPHVVKEIRSQDNKDILKTVEPVKLREVPLSSSTLDVVRTGMRKSVDGGTSGKLASLKIQVSGKTGTAQTHSDRKDKATQHAWFVGFGPSNAPPADTVVVAVLIEYGVAGSATAVPVAQQVFTKMIDLGYFNDQKK